MGLHLCYGAPRDEHLVQPKDLRFARGMMDRPSPAANRRQHRLPDIRCQDRTDTPYTRRREMAAARREQRSISGLRTQTTRPAMLSRSRVARASSNSASRPSCGVGRTEARAPARPVDGHSQLRRHSTWLQLVL